MNVEDVPYAVEARGLVKRFGKTTALAGVDLTARAGTVLGLLGPNGAGKTTAVRILATLLRPDSGEAYVCGYNTQRDAHQVRQLIGLTGQYASVDEGLSGTNNLIMIGRLLGLGRGEARARAAELLARFELSDVAGRRAKTYSGGMRRRLDLAASLVGRPRVLYLVLFTYVFGGAVSGSTHKYLQFSLPGVLVMSVVFASMGTGMMLNADITTGVFDRFRSLPIARAPLAGAILGDAIRYVISIAVTLGFGFVLGFRIEATLLTGGPAAGVVERSLLWTLGIFVVFAPLAVAAYRRRT